MNDGPHKVVLCKAAVRTLDMLSIKPQLQSRSDSNRQLIREGFAEWKIGKLDHHERLYITETGRRYINILQR